MSNEAKAANVETAIQNVEDETSYHAYHTSVTNMAQEIMRDVRAGICTDVYARIHEDCDGSFWVIYTYNAKRTLEHSSSDDAIFDDGDGMGSFEGCTSMSEIYTRAAYYALRADLTAAVEALQEEEEETDDDA